MPRTWLITGSSRGLGRNLAEAVLAHGDQLVATARRPAQLAELVERYPGRARAVALDVTDRAQADAAVQEALDAFRGLDIVVNNAGYANIDSIEDFAEDDFRAQIETNLWGVINVTRAALPVMREQRSGHIIQISSVGGRDTAAGIGPYQTAKWGVEGFSGVLQKEVAPLGIHVTIIEPGGFRTDWAGSSMTVHAIRDEYRQSVGPMVDYRESTTPLGDPAKAAQAILEISNVPEPPLRLLLGSDAYAVARAADVAKIASDEQWKELTLSTDHDDGAFDIAQLRRVAADAAVGTNPGGAVAASPLIFIATNRLKAGQLERERERVQGLVEFLEANEPRLIAFNEYVSDAGDEVTVVQVHPDPASMEAHAEIVRERAQAAYAETLEATVRIQVFGQQTGALLKALHEQAGNGVELSIKGEHLGGFTRSAAER